MPTAAVRRSALRQVVFLQLNRVKWFKIILQCSESHQEHTHTSQRSSSILDVAEWALSTEQDKRLVKLLGTGLGAPFQREQGAACITCCLPK